MCLKNVEIKIKINDEYIMKFLNARQIYIEIHQDVDFVYIMEYL